MALFRPLHRSDYPLLRQWLAEPHVDRWWNQRLGLDELEAKYGPRIDGTVPTHVFIFSTAQGPVGFIQWYRWSDYLHHAIQIGAEPQSAGIDLAIGDPTRMALGLGPLVIREFIRDIIFEQPDIRSVLTDVQEQNTRSRRAFERAGFVEQNSVRLQGEDFNRKVLRLMRNATPAAGTQVK